MSEMSRHDFSRDQLIVAMDRPGALATVEGLENPGRGLDAGADAIGTEEHRIMEKMWGTSPDMSDRYSRDAPSASLP